MYEIQPKAFIGRNTLVGPKLRVSIQADFLKPVSLTVDYNKAAIYKAGQALPGESTKHTTSFFLGLFPISGWRIEFSISTFLCFFYLHLFLLRVFSYIVNPPLFRSSYLSVAADRLPSSMFSLLHLLQSFSLRGLTISVSLLSFSNLCLPHLPLLLFLHS